MNYLSLYLSSLVFSYEYTAVVGICSPDGPGTNR